MITILLKDMLVVTSYLDVVPDTSGGSLLTTDAPMFHVDMDYGDLCGMIVQHVKDENSFVLDLTQVDHFYTGQKTLIDSETLDKFENLIREVKEEISSLNPTF